ncbi:MAG: hypothetical protein WCH84_08875, partial [Verrucomicrobiota bacterium]
MPVNFVAQAASLRIRAGKQAGSMSYDPVNRLEACSTYGTTVTPVINPFVMVMPVNWPLVTPSLAMG